MPTRIMVKQIKVKVFHCKATLIMWLKYTASRLKYRFPKKKKLRRIVINKLGSETINNNKSI